MLIKENQFRHWVDHFYGFGSWEAPCWFISHEEPGGDLPEEVAERFDYFHRVHPEAADPTLCDLRDLFRAVAFRIEGPRAERYQNLFDHRFGPDATLHGVWKNLIAFAHGYHGDEMPDLLSYQQEIFASAHAKREALIPLYPLPSPHNHAWYYSWLDLPAYPFLKSRASYEAHFFKRRIEQILDRIRIYRPAVVLMFGMENINVLKEAITRFFPTARFKLVKAVKLEIPQHHQADLDGTALAITTQVPALRHNRAETAFNWALMGRRMCQRDG